MKSVFFATRSLCGTLMALPMLVACASYGGHGLKPGESTMADVMSVMGQPAMRWENPDHSLQLSFPRGPAGYHSFMVYLAPDGRLERIENVMGPASFGKIQAGMTQTEVTRILGPSEPGWTTYYKARRELVWEWRYCDEWNSAARFDVLFDEGSGKVRSTMSWRENCRNGACYCSH